MQTRFIHPNHGRIKSGWNESLFLFKGKLTDKAIAKYQAQGYYDQDLKDARAKLRKMRKARRDGNFDMVDGRMIYRP